MRTELPVLPLFGCRRVEDACCCNGVCSAPRIRSKPVLAAGHTMRLRYASHPSAARPTGRSSARLLSSAPCLSQCWIICTQDRSLHAAPGRRSASRPSFAALCLRPARAARLCPHSHGSPPADRITMSSRGHVSASGFGTRRARVRSLSRSLSCTHASGVRCQTPGDAVPSQL